MLFADCAAAAVAGDIAHLVASLFAQGNANLPVEEVALAPALESLALACSGSTSQSLLSTAVLETTHAEAVSELVLLFECAASLPISLECSQLFHTKAQADTHHSSVLAHQSPAEAAPAHVVLI